METIPKSGYCNTNTFALVTLKAIEEIVGHRAVNAILHHAGLPELVNNYPPHNREKVFDFAHYAAIMHSIDDIYGPKGGRVLALRIGRATFADLLANYGAMAGVSDLAFRLLPLTVKLTIGINAMAKVFNLVSDQSTTIESVKDGFMYHVHNCPVCWGRQSTGAPICYAQVGLIRQGLFWVSNGREFHVRELACVALGDERCSFFIPKEPKPEIQ